MKTSKTTEIKELKKKLNDQDEVLSSRKEQIQNLTEETSLLSITVRNLSTELHGVKIELDKSQTEYLAAKDVMAYMVVKLAATNITG